MAWFVALYDYTASQPNHLSFAKFDYLYVPEATDQGWWSGFTAEGKPGWFPATYVQKAEDAPAPVGWAVFKSPEGRPYYVNMSTQETTWTRPGLPKIPDAVAKASRQASVTSLTTNTGPVSSAQLSRVQSSADVVVETALIEQTGEPAKVVRTGHTKVALVVREGKEFAVDQEGKIMYTDNFWGDTPEGINGFDILVAKHKNGKEVCKDMAEFIRRRAEIEEKYAQSLKLLAQLQHGGQEEGTMKTAWNQVKFDIENQSREHAAMAIKLNEQVGKVLLDFKDKQKVTRKDHEAVMKEDREKIRRKILDLEKAQRNLAKLFKEADIADSKKDPRVLKLTDERKKAQQAALDFKAAVEDYEMIRTKWEEDVHLACLDFQKAEEERVEFVRNALGTYLEINSDLCQKTSSSLDMVQSSVHAISAEFDREIFVKSKATGHKRPFPVTFDLPEEAQSSRSNSARNLHEQD